MASWFLWIALAVFVARELWRNIPPWMQRQLVPARILRRSAAPASETDPPQQSSGGGDSARAQGGRGVADMTSLATLAGKLSSLFNLATEKLRLEGDVGEDGEAKEPKGMDAAFLILMRLLRRIKKEAPQTRDDEFCEGAEEDKVAEVRDVHEALEGMDKLFELADWAYDEWPEEHEVEGLERKDGTGEPADDGKCRATCLRDALRGIDMDLLRHEKIALPGCVAHYVALDQKQKLAIVAVKGTSSLEDLLTDCCGVAVTEILPGPFAPSSPTEIRCHDGILTASKRLASDLTALVEDLLLPAGYKIVITGHSLGAGVAALVGILLRASLPALEKSPPDALKVVAFASPPILDHAAAEACRDFCTTVVNQADVIPRSSLANLAVLRSVLAHAVRPRMVERGLMPEDFGSAGAFLQHLVDGDDKEKEWFMTPEEIRTAIAEALAKVPIEDPEHLYVPGTVFLLYNSWAKETADAEAAEASSDGKEKIEAADPPAHGVLRLSPAARLLRCVELDLRMVLDHLSTAYRSSLRELLRGGAGCATGEGDPLPGSAPALDG